MIRTALALLLAAAAASANAAGAIYRCGPDGRTYSQTPCSGGTLMEAADPRTAAQRAEARRLTEAERKAAAEKERERKAAETAATPPAATAGNLSPAPAAAAASTPAKADKPAKDFVATVPKPAPQAK